MYVYRNPLEESLAEAEQTLQTLCQEKQILIDKLKVVTQQISEWQAWITHTQNVITKDANRALADAGLSHVCKLALERTQGWATAPQIRNVLAKMGIDLTPGYTNPMAVLHATLKRVGETYSDGGKTF